MSFSERAQAILELCVLLKQKSNIEPHGLNNSLHEFLICSPKLSIEVLVHLELIKHRQLLTDRRANCSQCQESGRQPL